MIGDYIPILEAEPEDLQKVQNVELRGTINFLQSTLRVMQRQEPVTWMDRSGPRDLGRGAIVNVASLLGLTTIAGEHSYAASKHGIMELTETAGETSPSLASPPRRAKPCQWFDSRLTMAQQLSRTQRSGSASMLFVRAGP